MIRGVWHSVVVLLWLAGAAACSIPQPEADGSVRATATGGDADQALAARVYQDQRVPDGFYRETLPPDGYYTITHVTSAHAGLPGPSRRLCADDFAAAIGGAVDDFVDRFQGVAKRLAM